MAKADGASSAPVPGREGCAWAHIVAGDRLRTVMSSVWPRS